MYEGFSSMWPVLLIFKHVLACSSCNFKALVRTVKTHQCTKTRTGDTKASQPLMSAVLSGDEAGGERFLPESQKVSRYHSALV